MTMRDLQFFVKMEDPPPILIIKLLQEFSCSVLAFASSEIRFISPNCCIQIYNIYCGNEFEVQINNYEKSWSFRNDFLLNEPERYISQAT